MDELHRYSPYSVFDGPWGGWGAAPTWFRAHGFGINSRDVYERARAADGAWAWRYVWVDSDRVWRPVVDNDIEQLPDPETLMPKGK